MSDMLFHALSNPCRRRIVSMLRHRTMSAGEIADSFSISQPSISRHLDVLKKAGVVTARRQANQMIYSLNVVVMQELVLYATEVLTGACCDST